MEGDAAQVPGRRGGLYRLQDGLYAPAEAARSPWDPNAQLGAGIGGLLMHLAEQAPTPVPMLNAHMTFDILGLTPFKPVEGHWTITRPGKRIQMVETTLVSDGRVTARGRILQVRRAEGPVLEADPLLCPSPMGLSERPGGNAPGMRRAVETLQGPSHPQGRTPGVIWSRLRTDLVDGVPTSPTVHAVMLADYGGGISNAVDHAQWISPNLDISLHLAREPVGPWLVLEARTMLSGQGSGLVDMVLGDQTGAFGRAHQILFIDPKPGG